MPRGQLGMNAKLEWKNNSPLVSTVKQTSEARVKIPQILFQFRSSFQLSISNMFPDKYGQWTTFSQKKTPSMLF